MAIPTIATVSPATGPAAGHEIITITGTNYRTRTATPGPPPSPALLVTAKVTFDGVEALYVKVLSATQLEVLLPPGHQDPNEYPETFPSVAVRVANLTDAGVEIPTEAATKTSAFTYQRATIALPAADPPLQQVIRAFIHRLKRVLWKEVVIRTHPDFSDEGAEYTAAAELPIVVIRVDVERDPFGSAWDNTKELQARSGYWDLYRPSRTYRLTFNLILAAWTGHPAYRMVDAVIGSFTAEPALTVPGDTRWSSADNEYPLDIVDEPKGAAIIGRMGTEAFSLSVRVSGVPTMPDFPTERVYEIVNIYLAMANTESGGVTAEDEL